MDLRLGVAPWHISSKCPMSPNPVTSVIACTPGIADNVPHRIQGLHGLDRSLEVVKVRQPRAFGWS